MEIFFQVAVYQLDMKLDQLEAEQMGLSNRWKDPV